MNEIVKQKLEKYLSKPPEELYDVIELGYVSACWIWKRGTLGGYGRFNINTGEKVKGFRARGSTGRYRYITVGFAAHVEMYRKYIGEIPDEMQLDHLCSNTLCVNPNHLEPVIQRVNVQRGNRAKLTPEEIRQIRELYETKQLNMYELAEKFNVTRPNIGYIINNKTWFGV